MAKKTTKKEQKLKELSEELGFVEEPKKSRVPRCASCNSKEVSVIGFCYDCGDTSETI